jgi:hypothetical protein
MCGNNGNTSSSIDPREDGHVPKKMSRKEDEAEKSTMSPMHCCTGPQHPILHHSMLLMLMVLRL